jgi:hypothetical protein
MRARAKRRNARDCVAATPAHRESAAAAHHLDENDTTVPGKRLHPAHTFLVKMSYWLNR